MARAPTGQEHHPRGPWTGGGVIRLYHATPRKTSRPSFATVFTMAPLATTKAATRRLVFSLPLRSAANLTVSMLLSSQSKRPSLSRVNS